jgi:flagellar hook-length control protein FliK
VTAPTEPPTLATLPGAPPTGGAPPGNPPDGAPFQSALEAESARTATAEGQQEGRAERPPSPASEGAGPNESAGPNLRAAGGPTLHGGPTKSPAHRRGGGAEAIAAWSAADAGLYPAAERAAGTGATGTAAGGTTSASHATTSAGTTSAGDATNAGDTTTSADTTNATGTALQDAAALDTALQSTAAVEGGDPLLGAHSADGDALPATQGTSTDGAALATPAGARSAATLPTTPATGGAPTINTTTADASVLAAARANGAAGGEPAPAPPTPASSASGAALAPSSAGLTTSHGRAASDPNPATTIDRGRAGSGAAWVGSDSSTSTGQGKDMGAGGSWSSPAGAQQLAGQANSHLAGGAGTHDKLWSPDPSELPAGSADTAGGLLAATADAASSQSATAQGNDPQAPLLDYGVGLQQTIENLQGTIQLAAGRGLSQARIALQPEELGEIRIHLTQTTQGLLARVTADTPVAAQALAAAHTELHQSLSALGINLTRLNIGHHDSATALRGDTTPGGGTREHSTRGGASLRGNRTGRSTASVDAPAIAVGATDATGPRGALSHPGGALVDVLV